MVNRWVFIAILVVLGVGLMEVAEQLGLLQSDSPVWLTCLFFTGFGVVLLLAVDILEVGPKNFLSETPLLVALTILGALAGAIAGLLLSVFSRH